MRRFLLDTHTLLWWLRDDNKLGKKCRQLIAEPDNVCYVSAATTWEIAIKMAIGKLSAPHDMDGIVEEEGFSKLPISLFHGQSAGALPDLHNDPFDRMLIAQAQAEGLEILSADKNIPHYGVKVVSATS